MLIVIAAILLAGAVLLANICAWALVIMPATFQRLNYSAPVAAWSAAAIAVCVWMLDGQAQSRIKVTLIAGLALFINALITHATARATRVRREKHWPLYADETIPVVGSAVGPPARGEAGATPADTGET